MSIKINVKCSNGKIVSVEAEPSNTILEVKEKVAALTEVPANQQRLVYSGAVLKDPQTVDHYHVQDGHTVHMVKGPPPAGSQPPPAAAPPAASAAPPAPAAGLFGAPAPPPAAGVPCCPSREAPSD